MFSAIEKLARFIHRLSKLAGTQITSVDLDRLVNATLIRKEKESKFVSDAFYPSGIPYMCDVKEAFKRVRNEWEDDSERSVESIKSTEGGTALHSWVQNGLLSRTDKLWGNWRCRSCGVVTEASFKPQSCANKVVIPARLGSAEITRSCADFSRRGDALFEYEELRLVDSEHNIRGKIDGVLMLDKWYVLEVKSTTEAILKCETRSKRGDEIVIKPSVDLLPMEKHIEQASIYVGMVKELYLDSGKWSLDPEKFGGALLVYVSRESFSFRSFCVPVNTTSFSRAKARVDTIRSLVEKGQPMFGQKICRDRNSSAAKTCKFRLLCFPYKNRQKNSAKQ